MRNRLKVFICVYCELFYLDHMVLNDIEVSSAVVLVQEGYSRWRVAEMMNVNNDSRSYKSNDSYIQNVDHLLFGIVRRSPYPQRQKATTS